MVNTSKRKQVTDIEVTLVRGPGARRCKKDITETSHNPQDDDVANLLDFQPASPGFVSSLDN
jgi:hypothetical protein